MHKRTDRRVDRTRAALRGALVGLILDKGYEDISVQDIVERANIGRSTFYMHYSGKDAVFSDSFRALEHSLKAALDQGGAACTAGQMRYTGLLFAHVDANRHLYRALAGQRGGMLAADHIRRITAGLVRRDFEGRPLREGTCRTTRDGAVHYAVGAIIGVLIWWLDHKTAWRSDDADAFLNGLIAPGLRGIFADDTGAAR